MPNSPMERLDQASDAMSEISIRLGELLEQPPAALVPTGAVAYFAMQSAPTGWLKANGAEISRSAYNNLFLAIGTTFGDGDGSTTFNLPDLRGEFVRGCDDGRGKDSSRKFGSQQRNQNLAHAHLFGVGMKGQSSFKRSGFLSYYGNPAPWDSDHSFVNGLNKPAHNCSTYSDTAIHIIESGGSEARPENIALNVCIKY